MALCQFRQAASINPACSVLHCYMGMALHKQNKNDLALAKLQVRGAGRGHRGRGG